ncbi:MAG: hypothetical protein ACXWJZ_01235 [Burkholderiaceae bacterium]
MQYPLFGVSQSGKSRIVDSQNHINLYCEIDNVTADKAVVTYFNTPGLLLFTSFGDTPIRGWIEVSDFIYAVHRGTFWEINNAGVKTSRGTVSTTSGRVDISYNGTQIGIVDGASMYCYTIATNAFVTVSSGLFATPASITYQDSYFITTFLNSGQFQISAQNDGTTFDALDYSTAESNPDNLVRVVADHGELVFCGDQTTEFWSNSGGQDFPYTNLRGTTLEFGLAAKWSLVKYNDSLAGLFKNRMGQVQVMMMVGHALHKISSNELDAIINGYSAVSDATAFAYMWGGHPMLQISFPTAGKSWLYDASTNMWSSLESGLSGGRHLAEIHVDYINKPRVTDYANGNIYTLDKDTYSDNGMSRPVEMSSKHVFNGDDRITIDAVQIDFEVGVGLATGQGSDPQAMLQVSRDGGFTWGNEIWKSIGKIGEYLARARWTILGMARDWVIKVRVTDPVKVVITGASMRYRSRK